MAIPSLLEEVKSFDEGTIRRIGGTRSKYQGQSYSKFGRGGRKPNNDKRSGECVLCQQANRNHNHYLSQCKYLPEKDKKFFAKSRRIMGAVNDEDEYDSGEEEDDYDEYEGYDERGQPPRIRRSTGIIRRVGLKTSPTMNVFYGSSATTITMDCGAEADLIRKDTALAIGARIRKSTQETTQADGVSPLKVVGEVHLVFTRGDHKFKLSALVVEQLDC